MRILLKISFALAACLFLEGCGIESRQPAPPGDPTIPINYIETWCRVTPVAAEGISFVVAAPLTSVTLFEVWKQSNGSTVSTSSVENVSVSASELQYTTSQIQITVETEVLSDPAGQFSGTVSDSSDGDSVDYPVVCRSLKLNP